MSKKPDKALAAAKRVLKKAQILKELSGKVPVDKRVIANKTESLCYSCSQATPLLCDWIKSGSRQGLKYKIKPAAKQADRHIVVTGCEKYAPGPLPPVAWERLDADLLAGVAGCSKKLAID